METVCNKATQLICEGQDFGDVNHATFGRLNLYIDREPSYVFLVVPYDYLPDNLKDKKIYVGSDINE